MKQVFTIVIKRLLLLVAVLMAFPSLAFEVDGLRYETIYGETGTVSVGQIGESNRPTGALVIPSTVTYDGTTYTVTQLMPNAFHSCDGLTSVEIPNTVTVIDNNAFQNCEKLISVKLPSGLTTIGGAAFAYCKLVTSLEIPASVTSIGGSAFSDCEKLATINIPEGITKIENSTFSGCKSLTSIEIPASVITIDGWAFSNCATLTSVKLEEGLKTIAYGAFSGCSSLTSIEIPASVTKIDVYAFRNCEKLSSVNLPDGITKIPEELFNNCKSLTSIEIPASVTSIGANAFNNCTSLTSIMIPASVTSIGEGAFSNCEKLTSANLPDGITEIPNGLFQNCKALTSIEIPTSVTKIGNSAFSYCEKLTSVNLPDGLTEIPSALFYNCKSLKSIEIPESVTAIGSDAFNSCPFTSIEIPKSVTSIGSATFAYCKQLTSVTLPDGITAIPDNLFVDCYALASVNIPTSVTTIGSLAFNSCSFTSIEIPASVTSIGVRAFSYCSKLTAIEIPVSVTSIGESAFDGCYDLRSVLICNRNVDINPLAFQYINPLVVCPEGTLIPADINTIIRFDATDSSVLPDGTVLANNGKTLVVVPQQKSGVYTIPEGVTTIASTAFTLNPELKELNIPKGIEYVEPNAFANITIEKVNFADWSDWYTNAKLGNFESNPYRNSSAYAGGVRITTPELKEGMTEIADYINAGLTFKDEVDLPTTIKRIGAYAFYNNKELSVVVLPAGLEEIGEMAFAGCDLLENPAFPAGLKTIEDGAYKDCLLITEITLPEGLTKLGEMKLRDDYDMMGNQYDWGVFEGCTSLEKAVVVADIDYLDDNLFKDCSKLEKVFMPLQLKTIGAYSFFGTALDEVTFPATLETIGDYAFAKLSVDYDWDWTWGKTPALTSVTIPNSVKTIGSYAFNWQRISDLTIGSGIEVISIGAFANNNHKLINFSEGLKEIGEGAFGNSEHKAEYYGYGMISAVNLPSTVTTIGMNAFANTAICEMSVPDNVMNIPSGSCGRPSTLTLGSGVKTIAANAFSFDKLYTLRVKAFTPPTLSDAFPLTEAQNDQLTLIVNTGRRANYVTNARWKQIDQIIEEGQSDVVIQMTGSYALSEEIRVTSGLMPSQVTKMKVVGPLTQNDLKIMKENMTALTSLDMSEVTGVTEIPESQFYGKLLTDIKLPANLESIGYGAFSNCGLLTISELPATLKTIGQSAFYNSPRVAISILPEGLESIGTDAFAGTGIRSITTGSFLNEIGHGAFGGCPLLETVDLSASAITAIPDNAFSGSYELDEIILPETVTSIGSSAFSGTALRNIDFAANVTSVGSYAFSNNRRLVAATLAKGLENVGSGIFSDCPRLLAVSMPSTTNSVGTQILNGDRKLSNISCAATDAPDAESGAFDGLRMRYVSLIVPTLSYRAYLNAPGWGKFQTIKNLIPVEIDNGVEVSTVAEEEYQQMLEEDALEEAEEAAAEASGEIEPSRAVRRSAARAATVQQFAALFDGAQIQTGDEDSGMRVFITPEPGVKVTSIKFEEEELISQYEADNSILLPKGRGGSLKIRTDKKDPEPSAIEKVDTNPDAKVEMSGDELTVNGVAAGTRILVFGIDGSLRGSAVANGGETRLSLTPGQIYLVKIGGKTFKVQAR